MISSDFGFERFFTWLECLLLSDPKSVSREFLHMDSLTIPRTLHAQSLCCLFLRFTAPLRTMSLSTCLSLCTMSNIYQLPKSHLPSLHTLTFQQSLASPHPETQTQTQVTSTLQERKNTKETCPSATTARSARTGCSSNPVSRKATCGTAPCTKHGSVVTGPASRARMRRRPPAGAEDTRRVEWGASR